MNTEKIKVRITESGQTMDVVVFSKRASLIQVVLGAGVHSVKCDLAPTRNGMALANTRSRIEYHFGWRGALLLNEGAEDFQVTLRLPES